MVETTTSRSSWQSSISVSRRSSIRSSRLEPRSLRLSLGLLITSDDQRLVCLVAAATRPPTSPTSYPPMQLVELGLEPDTHRVLESAGLWETDQIRRTAEELLAIDGMTGDMLFELVCSLKSVGLGLMRWGHGVPGPNDAPSASDCEILRLRVVEGRRLSEIGAQHGLTADQIKVRLLLQFGLFQKPIAWHERLALLNERTIERQVADRLQRECLGIPLDCLIRETAGRPEVEGK